MKRKQRLVLQVSFSIFVVCLSVVSIIKLVSDLQDIDLLQVGEDDED